MKPKYILAAFCWINFTALIWVGLLGRVPTSGLWMLAAVIFFVSAVVAAVPDGKKSKKR